MYTHSRTIFRGMCLFLALAGLAAPTLAATVATFADPAADGSTPLFTASGSSLNGGWMGTGLTLDVPIAGMSFADATFVMDPVVVNSDDTVGAGNIRFYEDAGMMNLILQIDFDSAQLIKPTQFGASFVSANDVTFSGPVITTTLADEQFAFSFANPVVGQTSTTYTASFTASAVPEPGTLALLGAAAMCFVRRRR